MIRELWQMIAGMFFRKREEQSLLEEDLPGENTVVSTGNEAFLPVELTASHEDDGPTEAVPSHRPDLLPQVSRETTDVPVTHHHGAWKVRTVSPRTFDKVGRLYRDAGDLVIKVEGMPFLAVSFDDVENVMDGGTADIREREGHQPVGTARRSVSGRAVNFRIGDRLFTVPLRNFGAVLEGKLRKAAVFEGNTLR
jgi:hypothetical protein